MQNNKCWANLAPTSAGGMNKYMIRGSLKCWHVYKPHCYSVYGELVSREAWIHSRRRGWYTRFTLSSFKTACAPAWCSHVQLYELQCEPRERESSHQKPGTTLDMPGGLTAKTSSALFSVTGCWCDPSPSSAGSQGTQNLQSGYGGEVTEELTGVLLTPSQLLPTQNILVSSINQEHQPYN